MALPAPAQPQPPRQTKGPPRHADAGGYAMTAPMTRADLEGAVSKLATKEELRAGLDKLVLEEIAPLREDVAALKVKVDNCATKADISDAMFALTWRMLGGMTVLMAFFKFLE